jgi:hypothetical protein
VKFPDRIPSVIIWFRRLQAWSAGNEVKLIQPISAFILLLNIGSKHRAGKIGREKM